MIAVVDHPIQTQAFTGEQSSKIISIKAAMIYILIPAVAVLTVISFTIIIIVKRTSAKRASVEINPKTTKPSHFESATLVSVVDWDNGKIKTETKGDDSTNNSHYSSSSSTLDKDCSV